MASLSIAAPRKTRWTRGLVPMPKDSQRESFRAAFDPEMSLLGILSRKSPLLYLE